MSRLIIVDIGHYKNGADTGAVANGIREVDINLGVATKLISHLKRHGFRVETTDGTLANRVNKARNLDPSLFVSIHANSTAQGTPPGFGSEIYIGKGADIERKIATYILDEIVAQGINRSRGVKEGNFYVIRNTSYPSMLIETAFINHPEDHKKVKTEAGQNRFAIAICMGILKWFKVDWIPENQQVSKRDGIILRIGDKKAIVDGIEVQVPVAPFIEQGTTVVPVRFIAEALGLKVSWDTKTQEIHITKK